MGRDKSGAAFVGRWDVRGAVISISSSTRMRVGVSAGPSPHFELTSITESVNVRMRACAQRGLPVAYVSFRLSEAERRRLRAVLAERGITLQEFMKRAVDENLDSHRPVNERRLGETVKILRRLKDELLLRDIDHLWIFGSVARGEERDGSDVDIVVELNPAAKVSLTSFARLQLDLTDLLGRQVDLATWKSLRDHAVDEARRDAVMVC